MSQPRIVPRDVPEQALRALVDDGVPAALARIFAARGIDCRARLDTALGCLLPAESMRNCERAAALLADAIGQQQKLLIVADYDADGATSCALAMNVLKALGARVEYLVPNRFEYGYGLTPEIVELAGQSRPDWLITVDNGIASVEGVERAASLGISVLITDHHLPGDAIPEAACIVNPNQPGCAFASKHLAGVGVVFYVLLALRAELRRRSHFRNRPEPNLADVLDLVALGTVADVARLDDNNRVLVAQGLRRIRANRARPGIDALFRVAGRNPGRASTYDLAFVLGPRLNAAGRLDDMSVGIECLLASDAGRAAELAAVLDRLNRERREIEAQMQDAALAIIEGIEVPDRYSLTLYDKAWHQGVIGVLASRLRERFHRPVFAFAPGAPGEAKGSGRSIAGLHLRDAIDLVAKRHPGLVRRFGGHAAAAGVTIGADDVARFADAFEAVVRSQLSPADLEQVIETDGGLGASQLSLELAEAIDAQVWGQGFAPPLFCDEFEVVEQRIVGGRHSRLRLRLRGAPAIIEAMCFGRDERLPPHAQIVYRLQVDEFNGARRPQLIIERWRAVH
jgi:single-stranded-DNA-specific exonuclease